MADKLTIESLEGLVRLAREMKIPPGDDGDYVVTCNLNVMWEHLKDAEMLPFEPVTVEREGRLWKAVGRYDLCGTPTTFWALLED